MQVGLVFVDIDQI